MRRRFTLAAVLATTLAALPAAAGTRVYVRIGPPAPIVETRVAAPGPHHVWVAGYHSWNGQAYVWVNAPRQPLEVGLSRGPVLLDLGRAEFVVLPVVEGTLVRDDPEDEVPGPDPDERVVERLGSELLRVVGRGQVSPGPPATGDPTRRSTRTRSGCR